MAHWTTKFATFIVAKRRIIVAALLPVAALAIVLALRVGTDFSPEQLFSNADEWQQEREDYRQQFGNTDNIVLILIEGQDMLSAANLQFVHDTTEAVAALDDVRATSSITNTPLVERAAAANGESIVEQFMSGALRLHPLVAGDVVAEADVPAIRAAIDGMAILDGKLVAKDRSLAAIAVFLAPTITKDEHVQAAVGAIERYLESHPAPAGTRVQLSGLPYIRTTLIRTLRHDQLTLYPAVLVVILLVLALGFRWLPAVILPMLAVAISAVMLVAGMSLTGQSINIINHIVPVLIIIVGMTDAIHILHRYGESLAAGKGVAEACVDSASKMTLALFLTSMTTAIGFGSLAISRLPLLRSFGLSAGAGMLLVYVVCIVALPAILAMVRAPTRALSDPEHGRFEGVAERATTLLLRYRLPVLGVGILALAGAAWNARNMSVDTALSHQFSADDEIYRAVLTLEDKLEGAQPVELMLTFADTTMASAETLNRLDELKARIQHHPGVLGVTSYADVIRQMWRSLAADPQAQNGAFVDGRVTAELARIGTMADSAGTFATKDLKIGRVHVAMRDVGGRAILKVTNLIKDDVREIFGDQAKLTFSGEGYSSARGLGVITNDLLNSLMFAIIIIFGVITLLLRSLRLGLISIPPNALPLLGTMAYMQLRDIPLTTSTTIIFAISLGLAVDGTIHILARFEDERRHGLSRDEALRRATAGTGKAVVVSYLALMAGFSVFQLSGFVPIRWFGELVSVTIGGCLVCTLLLLPPLIAVSFRDTSVVSKTAR